MFMDEQYLWMKMWMEKMDGIWFNLKFYMEFNGA
jgi:hypothetical protein